MPLGPVLQSVWVKTGALQWWCDWKPHKWVDVRVALEQFTGLDGARDSILFIYYVVHEEKKVCVGFPWEGGSHGRGAQSHAWDTSPQLLSQGPCLAVAEWLPVVTAAPVNGQHKCGGPCCCPRELPPHGAADSPWGFSSGR